MEITLVKNPARRKKKATKRSNPKRSKASYKAAAKKAAATRKRNAAKRSAAAKKAAATRKRRSRKSSTTRKAKRSKASYRKAAKKAAATRRRNAGKRRRNSSTRRRNPDVVQRVPVIGDMKIAKQADKEIAIATPGSQKFGKASLPQKAVQIIGGTTGYGYGGSSTQMGQNFSDNAIIGSGVGVITGVGGIAGTSYLVNTIMGDMLLKKHENKHHTFANFTKGWKVGGYIGVGLNTVTNLLTMYYGRSYSGLGSWGQLVQEAKHGGMGNAVKKMVAKSGGFHKLAHLPAVAGAIHGGYMYNAGANGPLQGHGFAGNMLGTNNKATAGHGADAYTDVDGYYSDNNDVLGYVDVMGSRGYGNPIGGMDNLGYPSGIGYPADFAENQPLY